MGFYSTFKEGMCELSNFGFIDESYFMLYMDNSKSIDVNVLGKTTDSGMFFF
jgi:hypothetical protein